MIDKERQGCLKVVERKPCENDARIKMLKNDTRVSYNFIYLRGISTNCSLRGDKISNRCKVGAKIVHDPSLYNGDW